VYFNSPLSTKYFHIFYFPFATIHYSIKQLLNIRHILYIFLLPVVKIYYLTASGSSVGHKIALHATKLHKSLPLVPAVPNESNAHSSLRSQNVMSLTPISDKLFTIPYNIGNRQHVLALHYGVYA
jgi:hypothetical protein